MGIERESRNRDWFGRDEEENDDNGDTIDAGKIADDLLDTVEQKHQGEKERQKVRERRHLGQFYQILREQKGIERTKIADELGVSYTDLALYEQGYLTDEEKVREIEAKIQKKFPFPNL